MNLFKRFLISWNSWASSLECLKSRFNMKFILKSLVSKQNRFYTLWTCSKNHFGRPIQVVPCILVLLHFWSHLLASIQLKKGQLFYDRIFLWIWLTHLTQIVSPDTVPINCQKCTGMGLNGFHIRWIFGTLDNWKNENSGSRFGATSWTALPIQPIYLKIGPNRQCCLDGSSKTAPRILVFSIVMGADLTLYFWCLIF